MRGCCVRRCLCLHASMCTHGNALACNHAQVVFEDEVLVVVNKQPGLTVHPCAGVPRGTLVNALAYHFNNPAFNAPPAGGCVGSRGAGGLSSVGAAGARPGIVHRLDRYTSGCGLGVHAHTHTQLRACTHTQPDARTQADTRMRQLVGTWAGASVRSGATAVPVCQSESLSRVRSTYIATRLSMPACASACVCLVCALLLHRCIIVAKSDLAHWRLAEALAQHRVDKRYVALVHGDVAREQVLCPDCSGLSCGCPFISSISPPPIGLIAACFIRFSLLGRLTVDASRMA